jgi:AcrR family transcriptional regulator
MATAEPTAKRGRGRPKNFDRSIALDQAMKLFWERGYEGTSFDELIAAMGISPSSFYNAFGGKEQLYHEAVDAYMARSSCWFTAELAASTDTKTAFRKLLNASAREFTQDDVPCGCMIAVAGTHLPPSLESVRDLIAGYRKTSEAALAERLRRGIAEGDLLPNTDVAALAAFYAALSRGMVVFARDGASRKRLLEIAEIGMRAWPEAQARR